MHPPAAATVGNPGCSFDDPPDQPFNGPPDPQCPQNQSERGIDEEEVLHLDQGGAKGLNQNHQRRFAPRSGRHALDQVAAFSRIRWPESPE